MKRKGKIEILSCKKEIVKLLNEGLSISYVHNKLYNEGKINTEYKWFTILLKKCNIKKPRLSTLPKIDNLIEKKNSNELILSISKIKEKSGMFIYEKNKKIECHQNQDDGFGIIRKTEDEVF